MRQISEFIKSGKLKPGASRPSTQSLGMQLGISREMVRRGLRSTDFCINAVEQAMKEYARLEMFNTDQGSQFTSAEFVELVDSHGITQSMAAKGCWRDNVFVGRFWRSIKYEEVYLRAYSSVFHAKAGIDRYVEFYNAWRPHTSLDRQTPDDIYFE